MNAEHPTFREALRDAFGRRPTAWTLLFLCVLAPVMLLDKPISDALQRVDAAMGGDVEREMKMLQQYGQLGSIVVVGIAIALLQPQRWRRLFDLGLAAGGASLLCRVIKAGTGRGRPRYDDPWLYTGPFGTHETSGGEVVTVLDNGLASMPSSHTAAAVAMSVFLVALYPRLRPLAVGLAVIVGLCRVIFGAHWASDVLVGAALSYVFATAVVRSYAGVRLLDWIWRRVIDRRAEPALPSVLAVERRVGPGRA